MEHINGGLIIIGEKSGKISPGVQHIHSNKEIVHLQVVGLLDNVIKPNFAISIVVRPNYEILNNGGKKLIGFTISYHDTKNEEYEVLLKT